MSSVPPTIPSVESPGNTTTAATAMPMPRDTEDVSAKPAESALERADRALAGASDLQASWELFNKKFDTLMKGIVNSISRSLPPDPPAGTPEALTTWHGLLGDSSWPAPKCVAKCTATARPGRSEMDSSEYADGPTVLKAKVKLLAHMIRSSRNTAAYTGAGISTAAGIPDYASKAEKSVAVDKRAKAKGLVRSALLTMTPTVAHHVLAALNEKNLVHFWLQQNHDGLAQKAGFPHASVCEIHGSWHDKEHNPVVKMSGKLRPDLARWMGEWERRADVVLALGTSLCGMASDGMACGAARRFLDALHATPTAAAGGASTHPTETPAPSGLCIVNLQRTPLDKVASLRIFGKLDMVLTLLAAELGVEVGHREPQAVPTGFFWRPESGEEIPDTRPKPTPAAIEAAERERQQEAAVAKLKLTDEQRKRVVAKLDERMRQQHKPTGTK
jgi:hypothetical protein